jgi:hypothetical protein
LEAALAHFDNEAPPISRRLIWFDDLGFGYYPVDQTEAPYDDAYFHRYRGYAATRMGHVLNAARISMVERHWDGPVVDVGVGAGAFVEARQRTWGYDINPAAVHWLHSVERYWNPYIDPCQAVTMWDSLEHIPRFHDLLANVLGHVFVSLPVFKDPYEAVKSRHFRPTEHCWYFTPDGLKRLMADLGWSCLEENWNETVIGRDSIASFAFARSDG